MARPVPSVDKAIKSNIPRTSRVLLAVSGGRDSVALLHGCVRHSKLLQLHIEVAHVDHGLRPGSEEDAEFVAEMCESLDVSFHLKRLPPPGRGENLEKWGRDGRYSFFASILSKGRLDYLLTAHTASDVAETLLMRLLANKEIHTIERFSAKRRCLRPLLEVTRGQVNEYVEAHDLRFVEDETNEDLRFLRNKIRHVLIPFLEEHFDKRIVEVLALRAAAADEDEAALRAGARRVLRGVSGLEGLQTRTTLRQFSKKLDGAALPVAWRVVQELLLPGLGYRVGRDAAKEALGVFSKERLAAELPGGFELRRSKGIVGLKGKHKGRSK